MKQVFRAALAGVVILNAAACSGGSSGTVLPNATSPLAASVSSQTPIASSPATLSFTALGTANAQTFNVSVRGDGALTAQSSNTQIATVSPGTAQAAAQGGGLKSATFTVTPVAAGSCTIAVSDKKGDATSVNVTVTLPVATISVLHEYTIPASDTSNGITNGVNGSVWFTQWAADSVGFMSATGTEANASLDVSPFSSSKPYGIAYGPDGNFWIADYSNRRIVQMNATGAILNSFTTPYAPMHITSGPDGNLWFTEEDTSGTTGFSEVVKLATTGTMTHYPTSAAAQSAHRYAYDIVPGPDGRLWFTEGSVIGAVTTSGAMTEYSIASGRQSEYLVAGADGNVWFTEPSADRIGRMSVSGASSDFAVPTQFATPWQIAAGKDGAVWFTENAGGQIGRAAADGTINEYAVTDLSGQSAILAGQDGNLWVTSYLGKMLVISY